MKKFKKFYPLDDHAASVIISEFLVAAGLDVGFDQSMSSTVDHKMMR